MAYNGMSAKGFIAVAHVRQKIYVTTTPPPKTLGIPSKAGQKSREFSHPKKGTENFRL